MSDEKKQDGAEGAAEGAGFRMRGKPGFDRRSNPKSGFQVIDMWFWADPSKRSEEWMRKEFAGLDRNTIEREYFGERIVYGGKPVYEGAWHGNLHVADRPLRADPRFPLVRGWDFAHNHAVVVCQWTGARLRVLAEFPNLGYNTRLIAPDVLARTAALFPDVPGVFEVVDPAGFADGKSSTGVSCTDVLIKEHGLSVWKGIISPPARIDSVVKLATTLGSDGKPLLEVSPECRTLIDGFAGAYHYPEKATQSQRADRPVKNHPYSDLHDCLQYVASFGRPTRAQQYYYEGTPEGTPKKPGYKFG